MILIEEIKLSEAKLIKLQKLLKQQIGKKLKKDNNTKEEAKQKYYEKVIEKIR